MIPEEYQRGFKEFLGIKIDLSKHPLIPREETEYWVSQILAELSGEGLDLCSGSGCIGLAVLKKTMANCDFGELDDDFIEQIKINLKGIEQKRYQVFKTDLFENISKKYDFILANPPYVALDRIKEVGEDVLLNEPHGALFSGKDGLDLIRKLIKEAKGYLKENGVLIFEFDPDQKLEIEEMILENHYAKFIFCKDQYNKFRFVKIWS